MENGKLYTKADVEAAVKDVLGDVIAEKRAEAEAKATEQEEKKTYVSPFAQESAPAFEDKREKGLNAARFLRLMAAGKGDSGRAEKIARQWGDKKMEKALNETVFEAGGALVPEDYMNEVIELLRAATVVRASGVPSIPMPRGSITMPYQSDAATASYIGELQTKDPSQPEFQQLVLQAKKLAALVPISDELLSDSSFAVDGIVRDDLVRVLALREDLAFIRGDGTSNTPKGLRNLAAANNVQAQSGATLDNITNDLHDLILNLQNRNIPMRNPGWLMHPRTASGIMRIRDGNGNFVYRAEMMGGQLMGFPYRTTTQIPVNLGGGTESELYLADFSSLIIGESMGLEIRFFDGGAYHNGSEVVSGISTCQNVMRAIARHDFGARQRGQEIAVLTGVTWGYTP